MTPQRRKTTIGWVGLVALLVAVVLINEEPAIGRAAAFIAGMGFLFAFMALIAGAWIFAAPIVAESRGLLVMALVIALLMLAVAVYPFSFARGVSAVTHFLGGGASE